MLPEIDALRVKALQERTGAGMMNCKIALVVTCLRGGVAQPPA